MGGARKASNAATQSAARSCSRGDHSTGVKARNAGERTEAQRCRREWRALRREGSGDADEIAFGHALGETKRRLQRGMEAIVARLRGDRCREARWKAGCLQLRRPSGRDPCPSRASGRRIAPVPSPAAAQSRAHSVDPPPWRLSRRGRPRDRAGNAGDPASAAPASSRPRPSAAAARHRRRAADR